MANRSQLQIGMQRPMTIGPYDVNEHVLKDILDLHDMTRRSIIAPSNAIQPLGVRTNDTITDGIGKRFGQHGRLLYVDARNLAHLKVGVK